MAVLRTETRGLAFGSQAGVYYSDKKESDPKELGGALEMSVTHAKS